MLATFGVTAAIAVPLLTPIRGRHHAVTTIRYDSGIVDVGGHPIPLLCKNITIYMQDCVMARP